MTYLIKQYREEANMTQEELSVRSGVSRATISKLETDTNVITTTNTLFKIANALNKPVSSIFIV